MNTVYILQSIKINRYYIGYTSNLELRLQFHADAESRKFTHKADDWTVFYSVNCESKPQALAIEKHIKAMKSKTFIENLKKYPEMIEKLLEKYRASEC